MKQGYRFRWILNWLLKEYADILSYPITSVLNRSFAEQRLPTRWKNADVIPVPKKKPVNDIKNQLRPISLTPSISKIAEDFVVKFHIGPAVLKVIDPDQFGAIPKSSTEQALISILHYLSRETDGTSAAVRLVLFDYRKAFDLIDHYLLVQKLSSLDIPCWVKNWVTDFLTDRNQRVKLSRYKLAVNCPVYACLLIILSSFTFKEVSNGDSYIKTKVSELYVGSSLVNTSLLEMSTTQQTKRPRERFEYGYVWGVRLLRVTRDVLLINLVLLRGDVALNPGPVAHVQCSKCLKSIRKNQGLVNCTVCTQPYHLKCVDAEFESSKRCIFCNLGPTTIVQGEENSTRIDIKQLSGLAESLKVRGLKFIHQNIRSLRGKLDELNIMLAYCPNLHVLAFTETWLNSNIFDAEISFPRFKIFRNDRVNRVGGGIAVYVRDSLSVIRRFDLESYFPNYATQNKEYFVWNILSPSFASRLYGPFC